jgi:hypothetical protein
MRNASKSPKYLLLFTYILFSHTMAQMKPQTLDPLIAAGKAPKAHDPVFINLI